MSWSPKKKTVSGNQVIDSSITFDNLGCTIDEDNMASDSATHVPTQQSVKAYVDANGGGGSSQWTTTGSDIYYNTGNVGIGTTSPTEKLHIVGGDLGIGSTQYRENNVVSYASADYSIATSGAYNLTFKTNDTERMRIDSSGNVGIGITDPHSLLHVDGGDVKISSDSDTSNGDGKPAIFFSESTADEVIGQISYHGDDESGDNNFIGIGCAGGSATTPALMKEIHQMVVTAGGKVGIGTDSPFAKLSILGGSIGTSVPLIRLETGGGGLLDIGTSDQSVANPTWQLQTGTGEELSFGDTSNEWMRIDSSGNVGIGTSSPVRALHVTGGNDTVRLQSTGSNTKIEMVNTGSTTNEFGFLSNNFFVSPDGTEAMRIDSSGNVGIGTTNPTALLHLESASAPTLKIDDSDSTFALELSQDGSDGSMLLKSAGTLSIGVTNNSASDTVSFQTQSTERMRIDSTGNVGIGTTSPNYELTVGGGNINSMQILSSTTGSGANDGLRIWNTGSSTALWNYDNTPILFGTNDTERMRIDSTGNVGIGTTSPAYALDISQTSNASPVGLRIQNSEGSFILRTNGNQTFMDAGTDFIFRNSSETERMRIDSSGNVGIGTTDPSELLHVKTTGNTVAKYETSLTSDLAIQLSNSQGSMFFGLGGGEEFAVATDSDLNGSNNLFVIKQDGSVGIGTTTPQALLHISAGYDGDATIIIEADLDDGNENDNPSIAFKQDGGALESQIGHTSYGDANQNALKIANSVASGGIEFLTGTTTGASNASSRMFIDPDGKVGIGTVTPALNLDINGDLAVRGSVPYILLQETDTTNLNTAIRNSSGVFAIDTVNDANTTGTTRVSVDHSTGNVGIGDITPATALHVKAGTDIVSTFHSTNAGSYIKITDSNSGTYGALIGTIADEMVFSPNNAIAMRISADGDVAIGGAVDDEELLRVYGSSRTDVLGVNCNNSFAVLDVFSTVPQVGLFYTNSTTGSYITFEDANSTENIPAAIGALGNECFIAAGGQERVRIDASGNVGIGITDPTSPLHVSGEIHSTSQVTVGGGNHGTSLGVYHETSAALGTFTSNATGAYILFEDATSQGPTPAAIGAIGNECFIIANGTEKVRIDTSGNLGIGTNDPTEKLDVQGNITATGVAKLDSGSATAPAYTFDGDTNTGMYRPAEDTIAFAEGGSERMRITSSGKVLIGTTSEGSYGARLRVPFGRIEASGYVATGNSSLFLLGGNYGAPTIECRSYTSYSSNTQKIMRFAGSTGTERGSITIAGVTTSYNTSSDERLKENISDAEDAGSKIDAIRIRQFDWKDGGEHQDYGVIAQELQSVAPEAVSQGYDEEDMWSVDYSKLVPTLIKEIQTLRNRVAQLENNE